jgi:hypothetical protein
MLIQSAPVSVGCIPELRLHEETAASRAQSSRTSQIGIDQADALSAENSRFRQEFARWD